jgi:hypothetical protein
VVCMCVCLKYFKRKCKCIKMSCFDFGPSRLFAVMSVFIFYYKK